MATATLNDATLESFAFWLRYPPPGRGRRPKGEATIQAYLYTVQRFLEWLEGEEPTPEAAVSFVKFLEERNSPRSVGRHIYALRSYFSYRGMELNLGAPSFQKRLPRWLDDDEWRRLLEVVEQPLWDRSLPDVARTRALFHRAAVMVYGGAGLRLSAGCSLRREHVNPQGFITYVAKGGEEATVPVEDAVILAIQDWVASWSEERDSPWVFPGALNGRGRGEGHIQPRTMQKVITDLMRKAGIQDIRRSVHMLRHTVGADLRKRGADLRDIQQVLHHSSISTTQIYTQMANQDLRSKLPRRSDFQQRRLAL